MTHGQHVLSVDAGTSGVKAAIVDPDGAVVAVGYRPIATHRDADGVAEQDGEHIWEQTLGACADAVRLSKVNTLAALMVVGQYSSVIPVDTDGVPVGPMHTWMDRRSDPKRLRAAGVPVRRNDTPKALSRWVRRHGLAPIVGGVTINHIRAIKYGRPDIYAATHAFLEPVDYIAARFSGVVCANQCSNLMSMTIDNRVVGTVNYDPVLVQQSLIDLDKLPPLVGVGDQIGTIRPEVAAAIGVAGEVAVLSGCNDTQAGSLATGVWNSRQLAISLGTSGVLLARSPQKKTSLRSSLFTMPGVMGEHILSAEVGSAGASVEQFVRRIAFPDGGGLDADPTLDPYALFSEAAASAPPGSGGTRYLPWLTGAIAPVVDSSMRGGFLNIGADTTRSDMARAVLEAISCNLYGMTAPLERLVGHRFGQIVLYGGAARSDLWAQMIADVFGRPVQRLAHPQHANARAIGLYALHRVGALGREDISSVVQGGSPFEPNPDHRALYDQMSSEFKAVFKKIRPVYRMLNAR